MSLPRRAILQDHHHPVDQVHFIERGVASVYARTRSDGPVEVACARQVETGRILRRRGHLRAHLTLEWATLRLAPVSTRIERLAAP